MVLRSRKKNAKEESINSLFKNSMLTGVPQIAQAGNWKKKVTRTVVFIMCVAGFIYQTLSFMNIYWRYETVVDVQVRSPMKADKPAYTICSDFGFLTQKFCKEYPKEFAKKYNIGECINTPFARPTRPGRTDVCKCYPRLCDKDLKPLNITVLDDDFSSIIRIPYEELKPYIAKEMDYLDYYIESDLYAINNLINEDNETAARMNPYPVDVRFVMNRYPHACFTRNSLHKKPDGKSDEVYTIGNIYTVLNVLNLDYPPMSDMPKFYISFHSARQLVNPMNHGYVLQAGKAAIFRLKKVIKNLLPYPYGTDCKDYVTSWKQRGGTGPLTHTECIQECLRNYSLATFGCLKVDIDYQGFDPSCGVIDTFENHDFIAENEECIASCKPACYEESYEVVKELHEVEVDGCRENINLNRFYEVAIDIRMQGLQTTVYTYSPKYQDIEAFSYIGGYIGMWLGISLIAVFDFLETVFLLMQYPLKRMRQRGPKNKIQNFRGGMNTY